MSRYMLHLRIDAADCPKVGKQKRGKLPIMQSDVMQRHQRAAYRKAWHGLITELIGDDIPPTPIKVAALRYTRASSVCPDWDGLVAGFKVVQDGLVNAGVLADDRMENTIGFGGPMPEYRWEQTKRGDGFILVELVEVER